MFLTRRVPSSSRLTYFLVQVFDNAADYDTSGSRPPRFDAAGMNGRKSARIHIVLVKPYIFFNWLVFDSPSCI